MRDRRGSTAVEFGLLIVPFFFLISIICEQGLIMLMDYSLQRGTEAASRQIRINTAITKEQFRRAVCQAAVVLPDCEASLTLQVQNAASFRQLTNVSGEVFEPGEINSAVRVRATYRWPLIFSKYVQLNGAQPGEVQWNFLSDPADPGFHRITGIAVFRNEP